jgi:hypothetical protein
MPSTTIQEVLGTEVLLGATGTAAAALPTRHMPPELLRGTPVGSNTGYVLVGQGTNATARAAHRGSAARPYKLSGMNRRPNVLLHSSNSFDIKADTLMNLVNPSNGAMQTFARAEVARQVNEATKVSMNLRTQCITSIFGLGAAWYDADGNPLSSSSGAVITIDPGIPANNRNQLNGLITASWANASTPIVTNLMNIQKQALVNSKGRTGPIENAIYSATIFNYIYNNTQAQAMIRNNPVYMSAFAQGVIPNGFAGIRNWWPGYFGFYDNASGTTVTPFADDTLTLFPAVDSSWYELQEGVQALPREFAAYSDLNDINPIIANGMFAYAYQTMNPYGATMIFGDNFVPAIHIPEVVFIADVVP